MIEMIPYVCQSEQYFFEGECIYPARGEFTGKWIYIGNFTGKNPHPDRLKPGGKYALVKIEVSDRNLSYNFQPQNRQYWDAASFSGDHLREVLGRDDEARRLADALERGVEPSHGVYQFVEPVYLEVGQVEPRLTPYERLDVMEQSCCALEELYGFRAKNSAILAHRDFKLDNLMIEAGGERFRVRLIDFASICCEAGDGTLKTVTSASNSAPEVVGVRGVELTGFEVSRKTDVFAMAGVLAQLFGSCNPIRAWNDPFWPGPGEQGIFATQRATDSIRDAYEQVLARYDSIPEGISWVEHERVGKFSWDTSVDRELLEMVQALFRDMIHIQPDRRLSLEEVHRRLEDILRWMEDRQMNTRCGSPKLYAPAPRKGNRSVYMVDRNGLERNRLAYTVAMKRAWPGGRSGETAYVCAYGTVSDPVLTDEALKRGCKAIPACPGVETLCASLPYLPDAEEGYSLLVPALVSLHEQGAFGQEFSGTVHIFTPAAEGKHLSYRGYDLPAAANLLRAQGAKIILHSVTAAKGEAQWYDRWEELLRSSVGGKKTEEKKTYGEGKAASSTEEKQTEPDPDVKVKTGSYVPPQGIHKGSGALYIKRGGEKIYVAKRV